MLENLQPISGQRHGMAPRSRQFLLLSAVSHLSLPITRALEVTKLPLKAGLTTVCAAERNISSILIVSISYASLMHAMNPAESCPLHIWAGVQTLALTGTTPRHQASVST
jgi:hypothetical protein